MLLRLPGVHLVCHHDTFRCALDYAPQRVLHLSLKVVLMLRQCVLALTGFAWRIWRIIARKVFAAVAAACKPKMWASVISVYFQSKLDERSTCLLSTCCKQHASVCFVFYQCVMWRFHWSQIQIQIPGSQTQMHWIQSLTWHPLAAASQAARWKSTVHRDSQNHWGCHPGESNKRIVRPSAWLRNTSLMWEWFVDVWPCWRWTFTSTLPTSLTRWSRRLSLWLCPVLPCPSFGFGSSSCSRFSCRGELERELENNAPGPAASSSSPTEELARGEHRRGPSVVWGCGVGWAWNSGGGKCVEPGTIAAMLIGACGSMEGAEGG